MPAVGEQLVRRAAGVQFVWERSATYQWTFGLASLGTCPEVPRRAVALASGDRVAALVGCLHHDRLHDGVIERASERWCRREGPGG